MAEEPYEEIDLVVDKDKFDALVAEDEKAYQDFKDSPMGKLLLSNLDGDWNALPSERTTGDLLRIAAAGRREYANGLTGPMYKDLMHEAEVLESAAKIADGDLSPMYSLLPSWRWNEVGLS